MVNEDMTIQNIKDSSLNAKGLFGSNPKSPFSLHCANAWARSRFHGTSEFHYAGRDLKFTQSDLSLW